MAYVLWVLELMRAGATYRVWKPNLNPKWAEIHGQTLALSPDQYH